MRVHCERHLGPPIDAWVHRGVRVRAHRSPEGGDLVLVTDGMRELALPPGQRPVELLMIVAPQHADACAVTLCDLAHYPEERQTTLHWFHALPLGVPIVPGSSLTSLLLTMPWVGDADFAAPEGAAARIIQAIPITEAERTLFVARGVEALEEVLEEAGTDLADFSRPSAV